MILKSKDAYEKQHQIRPETPINHADEECHREAKQVSQEENVFIILPAID